MMEKKNLYTFGDFIFNRYLFDCNSIAIICLTFFLYGEVAASTLSNNIALDSLGATAFDNGNWVEQVNPAGFSYDAMLAIDNNDGGTSIWFGVGSLPQQQMWVLFDQTYLINTVYINEYVNAYMTSGSLEYLQNGSWSFLQAVNKSSPDYLLTFAPIQADGVRLNIDSVVAPPGWINKVSGVYSLEVGAVPIPAAVWLFGSGLIALFGLARHESFMKRT